MKIRVGRWRSHHKFIKPVIPYILCGFCCNKYGTDFVIVIFGIPPWNIEFNNVVFMRISKMGGIQALQDKFLRIVYILWLNESEWENYLFIPFISLLGWLVIVCLELSIRISDLMFPQNFYIGAKYLRLRE